MLYNVCCSAAFSTVFSLLAPLKTKGELLRHCENHLEYHSSLSFTAMTKLL